MTGRVTALQVSVSIDGEQSWEQVRHGFPLIAMKVSGTTEAQTWIGPTGDATR